MNGESDLFQKFGQNVDAGKIIFEEGEEGDLMYIIQKGRVKVTKNISGKEQVLAILGKGEFFGEMAIVNKVRRTATITALDQVQLLSFNRAGFLSMINKNAKIALSVIDKLCRRLQNANIHIKHLARKDARGLVAMNLSYAFQSVEEVQDTLLLDRTAQEFSANLEISIEQVLNFFDQFKRQGIIQIEENTVRLLDKGKLLTIAERLGG